ncbi:uncharacterized protein LOC144352254, partial [Saccoglossus kowalevskii]
MIHMGDLVNTFDIDVTEFMNDEQERPSEENASLGEATAQTTDSDGAEAGPSRPCRFVTVPVTDDDVRRAIETQQNKNTAKKTLYDMRLLGQFLKTPEIQEAREIHEIPPKELETIICKFFISV